MQLNQKENLHNLEQLESDPNKNFSNKDFKVPENTKEQDFPMEINIEKSEKTENIETVEEKIFKDLYNIFLDSKIIDIFQNKYDKNIYEQLNKKIENFINIDLLKKQIDRKLDPKKLSRFIYDLYRPYVKNLSIPFLEQEAFNISNEILKYLEDK